MIRLRGKPLQFHKDGHVQDGSDDHLGQDGSTDLTSDTSGEQDHQLQEAGEEK